MDEATGQATAATANRGRKRRRHNAETVEHDTVETESAIVKEETPAKKVRRCKRCSTRACIYYNNAQVNISS